MKRFAFLGSLLGLIANRLAAQTRANTSQIALAAATVPKVLIVWTDGRLRYATIGTGLSIVDQSGVLSITGTAQVAPPPVQRLVIEPDKLSWRMPTPVANPKVHRNGLLLLPTVDYVIESGAVIRPTATQGTDETDIWTVF